MEMLISQYLSDWWLTPPAWPDSCTLSGNYGNVSDWICTCLQHHPRVSKTASKQTQHFPAGLNILDLPVAANGVLRVSHLLLRMLIWGEPGARTHRAKATSGGTWPTLWRWLWACVPATSQDDRDAQRTYFQSVLFQSSGSFWAQQGRDPSDSTQMANAGSGATCFRYLQHCYL